MSQPVLAGTRIRDYRTALGVRQVELARTCEISASYLNLIEHNRRRIGGALLLRLAEALGADPSVLSDGAEATLATALDAAAVAHDDTGAERDRMEELASRFPGWARLIEAQYAQVRRLEQVIERMDDRLTHDPFLSASMHNVLSSVTGIRSASAILANGGDIEPEWQARFHRNIYEDSQRLADATETLVGYLDGDGGGDTTGSLPQEDVETWLAANDWQFAALDANPLVPVDEILSETSALHTPAARDLARRLLAQYSRDAEKVPLSALNFALSDTDDPGALAARFGVDLPVIFRRLTAVPQAFLPGGVPFGLVGCDASGTLVFRKPVPGFDLPRYGGACPLWPLFRALQQPMMPLRERLTVSGRDDGAFQVFAVSEVHHPMGYDQAAVLTAWMLIRAVPQHADDTGALRTGSTCRVCAETDCPARREGSVFG